MLSNSQLKIAGDILVATGQVFLASLVIPFFITGFDFILFLEGVTFTAGSWSIALLVAKDL